VIVRPLVRVLDEDDVVVIVAHDVADHVIALDEVGDEVELAVEQAENVEQPERVGTAVTEGETLGLLLALEVVDGSADVVTRCDEPNVRVAGADSDEVEEEVTETVEVDESVDAIVGSLERDDETLAELDPVPVFTADVDRIAVEENDFKGEKVLVGEAVFDADIEEIEVNVVDDEDDSVL
jgi:hypothetical protein